MNFGFEQEDKLDLTNSNTKTQEKLQNVLLLIKVYEALIDYRIGAWSMDSPDTAQSVISLFKGYTRLVEVIKVPKIYYCVLFAKQLFNINLLNVEDIRFL